MVRTGLSPLAANRLLAAPGHRPATCVEDPHGRMPGTSPTGRHVLSSRRMSRRSRILNPEGFNATLKEAKSQRSRAGLVASRPVSDAQAAPREPRRGKRYAIAGLIFILIACNESTLVNEAELEYADKHFSEAIVLASKGLGKNPSNQVLLSIRAKSYIELGKNFEAGSDLVRLIELSGDSSLYTFLGHALIRQGHNAEAVQAYTNAINHDSRLNEALIGRSQALARIGECELAMRDLEELEKRGRDGFEVLNSIGLCLLNENRFNEALTVFWESHEMAIDSWIPLYNMSLTFYRIGNLDSAIVYNRIADNHCTESCQDFLLRERGKLFYELNEIDSACYCWRKADVIGDSLAEILINKYCR